MLDGLWTLEYEGDAYLSGGGVIVVQANQLLGGDSWYYFQGSINENGSNVSAQVSVRAFISSATTIFGGTQKEFSVAMFGELKRDVIRGRITPNFDPSTSVGITLIRR